MSDAKFVDEEEQAFFPKLNLIVDEEEHASFLVLDLLTKRNTLLF